MSQLTFEGNTLLGEIKENGYSFIDHDIARESVDALVSSYAAFTDSHPDPTIETMNRMITDPDELDILDYTQNTRPAWNKYHTNYPEFAKPGGYTNRSLQTASLREYGRKVTDKETGELVNPDDDPKEFYHFHPNSTVTMNKMHEQYGWGPLPPEVNELHMRFASIHHLGAEAIKTAYKNLEETHPELLPKHFGPADVMSSPVRLLFYHPGQGDTLAAGHYDKAQSTLQIAESHLGLWIRDPKNGLITRSPDKGVFFLGKAFKNPGSYPESELKPGWHGVINMPELSEGREMHGQNVARWAIIFFANSIAGGTIIDKSLTHIEVDAK